MFGKLPTALLMVGVGLSLSTSFVFSTRGFFSISIYFNDSRDDDEDIYNQGANNNEGWI